MTCLLVMFIKSLSHALPFASSKEVPGSRDATNLGTPLREEQVGAASWEPVWHLASGMEILYSSPPDPGPLWIELLPKSSIWS